VLDILEYKMGKQVSLSLKEFRSSKGYKGGGHGSSSRALILSSNPSTAKKKKKRETKQFNTRNNLKISLH
jgi:hypothetical protein